MKETIRNLSDAELFAQDFLRNNVKNLPENVIFEVKLNKEDLSALITKIIKVWDTHINKKYNIELDNNFNILTFTSTGGVIFKFIEEIPIVKTKDESFKGIYIHHGPIVEKFNNLSELTESLLNLTLTIPKTKVSEVEDINNMIKKIKDKIKNLLK